MGRVCHNAPGQARQPPPGVAHRDYGRLRGRLRGCSHLQPTGNTRVNSVDSEEDATSGAVDTVAWFHCFSGVAGDMAEASEGQVAMVATDMIALLGDAFTQLNAPPKEASEHP